MVARVQCFIVAACLAVALVLLAHPSAASAQEPTAPTATVASGSGSAPASTTAAGDKTLTVDLGTGKATRFATIPAPVAGKGFMTGLRFGSDGALYAALVSFDPSVQPGIYKVPASGGSGALFAKDPGMVFPNGLLFDASGALFVTDSAAGAVFRITPAGAVTRWASSKLLAGDKSACGGSGNGFDIGANGLTFQGGAFYVTNTDQGTVLRIASRDGAAGDVELAAGPNCAALAGADGVTTDSSGGLVIAVNRQNRIVRLGGDGAITTIATGDAVEFPASVEWNGASLLATSFALANASSGKAAHPALIGVRASK